MPRTASITLALTASLLMAAAARAEMPNLVPGLWAHHSTTTFEGLMSLPPQNSADQRCVTQQDLDKGIAMLDIPQDCSLERVHITRDRADYAANCVMYGMPAAIFGHARFAGDSLDGRMSSEMNTPMGTMTMLIDYQAHRIGDCR